MSTEALAYPFLFLALFFESFVLVTFLSKPARAARALSTALPEYELPDVAVVVPCYNEEATVARTVATLLALDYPIEKLELVLVDDGSRDGTSAAMEQFVGHPQIRILRKENGGKHTALNAGIAATAAEIVGCLDADSFVEPNALKEIVARFARPEVAAVTAAMTVAEPTNLLEHMQNAEYTFGVALRHALSTVNGLYVTPGPFSFYRRAVVQTLGGFCHGHQTEDMEMALRLQREGYAIENAPRARVYTKAPRTLFALIKQRTRWTSGFMRNVLGEYRPLVGNRRYGALGTIVLPVALLAISSGIVLFVISTYRLASHALTAVMLREGIPLSYALMPHHLSALDWFYAPASLFVLLAGLTLAGSLSLIVIGKRLAQTPVPLPIGLFSYVLLYGLVVPLWLIRATADVALGTRRSWR